MLSRLMSYFRSGQDGARTGDIPTLDLYFLYAMGDLVGEGGPIRRLGPFTFAVDRHLVIIRYITPEELHAVRRQRWDAVFYVLDDALPWAVRSPSLPEGYRRRLAGFVADTLPSILDLDPTVLAPSPAILKSIAAMRGEAIDPCLPRFLDPQAIDEPAPEGLPGLCFLGTRSHEDAGPLLETVADALARQHPGAALRLFWGEHAPRALQRHPAIDNRRPEPWPRFRQMLRSARFDIALAPLDGSPFNAGRSVSKILDHALVGAAGIYSNRPPYSDAVTHGVDGLLVEDAPAAWIEAVTALIVDPARRRRMAEAGLMLANRRGDPHLQRTGWFKRLGLDPALL